MHHKGDLTDATVSSLIRLDTEGRFGPGLISFHESGDLIVAGDASRVVFRYDANTGEQIDSFTLTGCCNIVGLTLQNDSVYAAEYFQHRILRFDVSASPVTGAEFVSTTNNLSRPLGMTIGHNGNLMVADAVYQLDTQGTLMQTLTSPALSGTYGIAVVPEPSSIALALLATLGLSFYRRPRQRTA